MKREEYWLESTIAEQARIFLESVMPWRQNHSCQLAPPHCALLVLDMQQFFLDPACHAFIPSAPAMLPNIRSLQATFLDKQLPVFLTKHTNDRQNAGCMKDWWQALIDKEKPEAAIVDQLIMQGVRVIEKHQYDAFFGTDLENQLKERGVKQLVVGGVMTHLCCETTARSAFVRGFEVFFLVDGTATYNRAFHQASLQNLSHGFGVPVLVQEIINELESHHAT